MVVYVLIRNFETTPVGDIVSSTMGLILGIYRKEIDAVSAKMVEEARPALHEAGRVLGARMSHHIYPVEVQEHP